MREELFNTFLKAHGASATPEPTSRDKPDYNEKAEQKIDEEDEAERERTKREKKERAVREREERVKVERSKVEAAIDRSRMGLTKEEGELEFRCAACLVPLLCSYWAPLTLLNLNTQDDAHRCHSGSTGTNAHIFRL